MKLYLPFLPLWDITLACQRTQTVDLWKNVCVPSLIFSCEALTLTSKEIGQLESCQAMIDRMVKLCRSSARGGGARGRAGKRWCH